MQSLCRTLIGNAQKVSHFNSTRPYFLTSPAPHESPPSKTLLFRSLHYLASFFFLPIQQKYFISQADIKVMFSTTTTTFRNSTGSKPDDMVLPRIKFKRLDKTAKYIMQILDKEAVEEVKAKREIPDIRPGYIVKLREEVPENKRRVTTLEGVVIARRNAGLNTTFRLRRMVAGVGYEYLFPLNLTEVAEWSCKRLLEKERGSSISLIFDYLLASMLQG